MKPTATISTLNELKYAKLASWLEKPPRLTVEKAWVRASTQPMPAHAYPRAQSAVSSA